MSIQTDLAVQERENEFHIDQVLEVAVGDVSLAPLFFFGLTVSRYLLIKSPRVILLRAVAMPLPWSSWVSACLAQAVASRLVRKLLVCRGKPRRLT